MESIFKSDLSEFWPRLQKHIRDKITQIGEQRFHKRLAQNGSPLSPITTLGWSSKMRSKKGINEAFDVWLQSWILQDHDTPTQGSWEDCKSVLSVSEEVTKLLFEIGKMEHLILEAQSQWSDQEVRSQLYMWFSEIVQKISDRYDLETKESTIRSEMQEWALDSDMIVDESVAGPSEDDFNAQLVLQLAPTHEKNVVSLTAIECYLAYTIDKINETGAKKLAKEFMNWKEEKKSFETILAPALKTYLRKIQDDTWSVGLDVEEETRSELLEKLSHILNLWNVLQVEMWDR